MAEKQVCCKLLEGDVGMKWPHRPEEEVKAF